MYEKLRDTQWISGSTLVRQLGDIAKNITLEINEITKKKLKLDKKKLK